MNSGGYANAQQGGLDKDQGIVANRFLARRVHIEKHPLKRLPLDMLMDLLHSKPLARRALIVQSKKNAMKIPRTQPINRLNETINFVFGLNGLKGGSVFHAKEASCFPSIFSIVITN